MSCADSNLPAEKSKVQTVFHKLLKNHERGLIEGLE